MSGWRSRWCRRACWRFGLDSHRGTCYGAADYGGGDGWWCSSRCQHVDRNERAVGNCSVKGARAAE